MVFNGIKRHPVYPYNICYNGVIMENGFADADEDIPLDLIFFSPFEELRMRTDGIMESKGIHRVC